MVLKLPPLPFAKNALEPYMSARTVEIHYERHHRAYIDTTKSLIQGTPLQMHSLEDIILATAKDSSKTQIFNAAAQAWNHAFFWRSIMPRGGGKPVGEVLQAIDKCFGGYDRFRQEFKSACLRQFGSGWVWLAADGDMLEVLGTPNAVNPLSQGLITLLACDVWEHAYYLDFQDRRAEFVDTFIDHLVNWDYVKMQWRAAAGQFV